jgi:hypothetical protein
VCWKGHCAPPCPTAVVGLRGAVGCTQPFPARSSAFASQRSRRWDAPLPAHLDFLVEMCGLLSTVKCCIPIGHCPVVCCEQHSNVTYLHQLIICGVICLFRVHFRSTHSNKVNFRSALSADGDVFYCSRIRNIKWITRLNRNFCVSEFDGK